tara:strand:+ start:355 stop:501 length:147 start_codon:yes stop_codon:yes gene_type:complete
MQGSVANSQSSTESFDLGQYKKAASLAYQFAKEKAEKTQTKESKNSFV